MDAHTHERQTAAERLAPIAQGLASRQYAPDDLQSARDELLGIAAALDEMELGDWSATAAVLSDLVEIAACSLTDMDGHESGRLVDCIVQGVSLLQKALLDPEASTEQLTGFLDEAREDWSDCLAVVDRDEHNDSNHTPDAGSEDWVADADQPPSSDEVQLILATLGNTTAKDSGGTGMDTAEPVASNNPVADHGPTAAYDDVPKHLFDSATRESGDIAPPTGVPVVDDIVLEPELH